MSLTAPLDMTTDGQTLSASVGSPTLTTDVIYPDGSSAADTEALLTELAPLLLPILTDALGEIAIPSIQGFNIQYLSLNLQTGLEQSLTSATDGTSDACITFSTNSDNKIRFVLSEDSHVSNIYYQGGATQFNPKKVLFELRTTSTQA